MKSPVLCQKLDREIVFVADYTLQSLPLKSREHSGTVSGRFNSIAPGNRLANHCGRGVRPVARQIRSKESAIARQRVAIRATRRAEENGLAASRIARKIACSG